MDVYSTCIFSCIGSQNEVHEARAWILVVHHTGKADEKSWPTQFKVSLWKKLWVVAYTHSVTGISSIWNTHNSFDSNRYCWKRVIGQELVWVICLKYEESFEILMKEKNSILRQSLQNEPKKCGNLRQFYICNKEWKNFPP